MNEQEFGSAPIGKLFVHCTVPTMVGMGFSAIASFFQPTISFNYRRKTK